MTALCFAYQGALQDMSAATRAKLFDRRLVASEEVRRAVSDIIESVRQGGDTALRRLSRQLDGVTLTALEVPRETWASGLDALAPDIRSALSAAADNIARAHTAWLPQRSEIEVTPGVRLIRRPLPLDRIGVYAPGGRAAYASSMLMGVVPARVAGVRDIVVCSPPSVTGLPSDMVMAAAELAGATRLFAIGGAGAIAAMALGTSSVPLVDCIVGPGNAYVTEAKLQLMREVRTDLPAGPSEILLIADDSADLCAVAAELSAQAEHGGDSAAVAVLVGAGRSAALAAALAALVPRLPRAATIRAAFANGGAIIEVDSMDDALAVAEAYAPEHLLIATRGAASVAERVRNAGCVFVGLTSSVALGDYITGANHVLPTAGYARTHSGLSTESFMRWTTVQVVEPGAAQRLGPPASALAQAEGLAAHAAAALQAGSVA